MSYSLLIANDFPPVTSGIATFFDQIWRLLPPEHVRILAPELPGAREVDAGYPVPIQRIWLPVQESPWAKVLKTLLTLHWTVTSSFVGRPTCLHCGQVFSSGLAGWLCRRWFKIPYVVYVYGSETVRLARKGLPQKLMRRILLESNWVITNSRATTEEFIRFGVPHRKLRRIYPGVDPRIFHPTPKHPDWVKRLGLDGHRVVLTVARLDQRKGHDMVMQALTRMEGADDVIYLIAGRGREEAHLKALARDLSLQDRVRFLGFVPDEDLPIVYNLCDLHVMPNRVTEDTALEGDVEGFGISFLEAGACEKPVIGGRSGGAVEAIVDGRTGLIVDPYSEDEIAQAIKTLLEDPSYSSQLGKAARHRIEREFDWRILARQVEEIL